MIRGLFLIEILCVAFYGVRAPAQCSRSISAIDSGWYDARGFHVPQEQNYFVGDWSSPNGHPPYRNWFVFEIPPLPGPIGSVSLEVYTHDTRSVDGMEFYQLREVTTPILVLRAGGVGLTNIYQDLGDGRIFGGGWVSTNQRGAIATIPLNADLIAALLAAQGGMLALGGDITSLDGTPGNNEYLFGYLQETSPLPGVNVRLHVAYAATPKPFFLYEPRSADQAFGSSYTMTVGACALTPVQYQWTLHGTNLPGADRSFLALTNIGPVNAGDYRVVATAGAESVTSGVARVTVAPIVIRTQLVSQVVLLSNQMDLKLTARGIAPLSYQWIKDGVMIWQTELDEYQLAFADFSSAGDYQVIVTNLFGAATSAVAHITVEARAPFFVVQPTNVVYSPSIGSLLLLHASARAGPPPTYQWLFNGQPLPGETSETLYLLNPGEAQAGEYQLVAANILGQATSAVARVMIDQTPPSIYQQPQSATVPFGQSFYLYVGAAGAEPLSFQWYFNSSPLPGQTENLLHLTNFDSSLAGAYQVTVTNRWGAATSEVATLTTPLPLPRFEWEPADISVLAGANVYLNAYASGPGPIDYRWRFNGFDIPGANDSYLYLDAITTNQAGRYTVVARNGYGETESTGAVVTVRLEAPRFLSQPAGAMVDAGSTFTLYSVAEAAPPPQYQWRFNGIELQDQTRSSLDLVAITQEQAGRYDVIARNELGSATSAVAVITVRVAAPEFLSQPQSQTVRAGDNVWLGAFAQGAPPPSYQWRFHDIDIPDANSSTLFLANVKPSQSGPYTVVAGNFVGSVTSLVASITVEVEAPRFIVQPQGGTFLAGEDVELAGVAEGAPPPAYQWLHEGQPLRHETDPSLALFNVNRSKSGSYSLVASNLAGVATSDVAVVTVRLSAPEFVTQPVDQEVLAGNFVSFSAEAIGGPPPTYQWLFNGSKLHGQTDSYLSFYGAMPSQAGEYRSVAMNAVGTATSEVAVLTVLVQQPIIIRSPASGSVLLGNLLQLDGDASGAPPPGFRWFKDGSPVPRATSPVLYVAEAQPEDAGNYTLVATNVAGAATSHVAVVTVAGSAPRFIQQPISQQAQAGNAGGFTAVAEAGPPPSYQWQFQNEDISDETNTTLYLPRVRLDQAGPYQLIARNVYGAATSEVATLTVEIQAPRFEMQPQNLALLSGQNDQLYALASGAPPPAYQWYREGAPLPGATNNFFPLAPATEYDEGRYVVVAGNIAGVATSRVAVVTVQLRAPTFSVQPDDVTVRAGSSVQLSAFALGGPPPGYQWLFAGQPIAGAREARLSLDATSPSQQGGYSVVASNVLGMVTSRVARVTVLLYPPHFLAQPEDQVVEVGDWISLYSVADGAPLPQYQWFRDGEPVQNGHDPSLQLYAADASYGGRYYLIASNSLGTATSEVAVVTLELFAPEFVTDPSDQTVLLGETARFEAEVIASPFPQYQWRFNGLDLPNQTSAVLQLYQVTAASAGVYALVASNAFGMATSQVATLTVLRQAPEFVEDPQDATVSAGSYVQLGGKAHAGPPPAYQWLFQDRAIAGATDPLLRLSIISTNQAGAYRLVARNPYGSATSAVAWVTVLVEAPVFLDQPVSQSVLAGDSVTFSTWADGAPPPFYQWRFNGAPILGAQGQLLNLVQVGTNQAGQYSVVARNSAGAITSRVASLSVRLAAPKFLLQPDDASSLIGDHVTFVARAIGGPTPTYQWRFNGLEIANATQSTLDFAVSSTNQAGGYSVVAQNAYGAVTSRLATLTVRLQAPEIDIDPADENPLWGETTSFFVHAHGSPPPAYQWLFRGSPLLGATNQYVSLVGTPTAEGAYAAVASNSLGSATSHVARLTLRTLAPRFLSGPVDLQAPAGGFAYFCVLVEAGPPAALQWQYNGMDLPFATNACLNLMNVAVEQAGGYAVIARSPLGVVTSAVARLTVVASPPKLTAPVAPAMLTEGMNYDFRVSAQGAPTPRLWLQRDGQEQPFHRPDWDGFHLREIGTNDAGFYSAVASNSFGVVTSATVRLQVTPAGPLDRWTRLNPTPTDRDLLGLAYGNGLFVAVGDQGTILTSTNGSEWMNRSLRISSPLVGVAFGGGQFVATGGGGLLLTSSNGVDWLPQGSEKSTWPNITYGNGRFVAVGGSDAFSLTSSDGIGWAQDLFPGGFYVALQSLTWGSGFFLTVSSEGIVYTSPDGITWIGTENFPLGYGSRRGVAYGQDQFVAWGDYGFISTSRDGVSWSSHPLGSPVSLSSVAYGNSYYVAVGSAVILRSPDATNWTQIASDISRPLYEVLFAEGRFVAVGAAGLILVSTNGYAWSDATGVTHEWLRAAAGSRDRLVVVGEHGTILWSTNGEQFARAESGVSANLNDVVFTNNLFLAVGSAGTILTSTDARQWQTQPFDPTSDLLRVVYGRDQWLAVGRNGLTLRSTDGRAWTASYPVPGSDLVDVAFGQDVFVAANPSVGAAFVSPDGSFWDEAGLYADGGAYTVGFADGLFVATGNQGQLLTSGDGYQWESRLDPGLMSVYGGITRLARGRSYWLAIGGNGFLATSRRPISFTTRVSRSGQYFLGAAFFRGRFVVAGSNGILLQSDRLGPELIARLNSDGLQLTASGEAGDEYWLQGSDDMVSWQDLSIVSLPDGTATIRNPETTIKAQRFYRLGERRNQGAAEAAR